jgi:hypothetical protein
MYTLSTSTIGAGSGDIGLDPPGGSYPSGRVVTLTANPAASSNFTGWSGALSGTINPNTITMDAPKSVGAAFTLKTNSITATAGTGGTVSPAGVTTVNYGANKDFTVSANTGFVIATVTVDGVPIPAAIGLGSFVQTFTNVTAPHTIHATFNANTITYTITAAAGPGGTISPSGAVTVSEASNQTFIIAPNSGYFVQQVTVDGSNLGALPAYTFTNVVAAHTISATFSQDLQLYGAILTSDGKVGIGVTDSLTQALEVKGNTILNGNVGIGADPTDQLLTIQGNWGGDTSNGIMVRNTDTASNIWNSAQITFDKTAAGPGRLSAIGMGGPGRNFFVWVNNHDAVRIDTAGHMGVNIDPSTDPKVDLRVAGFVEASGFKVGNYVIKQAPDYVFAKDYNLRPLADVKKFLEANQHLPEMPSAKEIQSNGVDLVELNMTLLKKVEELTLYAIQQQAEIESLKKIIINGQ